MFWGGKHGKSYVERLLNEAWLYADLTGFPDVMVRVWSGSIQIWVRWNTGFTIMIELNNLEAVE